MVKNKHAAMEMSVGTIVTIVLLMAVLVLGLVLIKSIFKSSTTAVSNVDSQIQNQISKIFEDEGGILVIYPSSREITLNKDDDPAGFAFAVKNEYTETTTFSYKVFVQDISDCGSSFTEAQANSLILGGAGSFSLKSGEDTASSKDLVKFVLNADVPICTMIYRINVCEGTTTCSEKTESPYATSTIFVTIE